MTTQKRKRVQKWCEACERAVRGWTCGKCGADFCHDCEHMPCDPELHDGPDEQQALAQQAVL